MILVHATSVALGEDGILLRGPPAGGKSDLALRLIDAGALLVADDQTELRRRGGELLMSAPAAIAGLIEVRGLGIVRLPSVAAMRLRLVVDLTAAALIERLPEPRFATLDGLSFPLLALDPFAASAVAKLRLALTALAAPAHIGALAAS